MKIPYEEFINWVEHIAELMAMDKTPPTSAYNLFLEFPQLVLKVVDFMDSLQPENEQAIQHLYSACIFILDVSITQLHTLSINGNKSAKKLLTTLMNHLALTIQKSKHGIGFWLPVLNPFYDTHTELTHNLKAAFFDLANDFDESFESDESQHMQSMRDLLNEMKDLSIFDKAESFLAQSYAMPPDFFADLILDLFNIEEGREVGLLLLLHPNKEIRNVVLTTLDSFIENITLSSTSLSRLKSIMYWYPEEYHATFEKWIKAQRKKGVIFLPEIHQPPPYSIKASEVDGSASQGLFIHIKKPKNHRLCGLLLKRGIGIKDAWMTPVIPAANIRQYYGDALEDSISIRKVDQDYFTLMTEHFLAETIEKNSMPDLHLLEMQEILGFRLRPKKLDVNYLLETIAVQISPFTQDTIQKSFKRSEKWHKTHKFTASWFIESSEVDKLVNAHSYFNKDVKACRIEEAQDAIFSEILEKQREDWIFHFLWTALWAKSEPKGSEKVWIDSFLISYAIYHGYPLHEIPIMRNICHASIINSVETMHERGTYLS